MSARNALPLNGVFGPTWQGEGPHAGRLCHFIRLGQCNLSCTWCDTPDTWDTLRYDVGAHNPWTPVERIADQLAQLPPAPLVVVSGGEPLLHQRRPAFTQLLAHLTGRGITVHVETNATIPPTEDAAARIGHFTASPKLANNGADPLRRRIQPRALYALADLSEQGKACFKFVASTPADLDEVDTLADTYRIPSRAVWIMPEGTHPGPLMETHRTLAEQILERGYNTTTRLHTLLWGNERNR